MARFVAVTEPGDVLDAINGQTRYQDLADGLDVPTDRLDQALMQLAKDGQVSLLAVGDSLSIRVEGAVGSR